MQTVMAIGAVIAANLYNGLNTRAWNWWVFGSVIIGPVLIVLYTAVYSAFPPSLIWSYVRLDLFLPLIFRLVLTIPVQVWGNNTYLWPSAYFWLGLLFTIVLSLLPRYLYRFLSENYWPSNVQVLSWTSKMDTTQCVIV